MTRVLLVGERFNDMMRPTLERYAAHEPSRWLELSLRLGCMGAGYSGTMHGGAPGSGEQRLRSIGLRWTSGLNLLPPSPIAGEWDHEAAHDMSRALAQRHRVAMSSMTWREHEPDSFVLPSDFMHARWVFHIIVLLGRRVGKAFNKSFGKASRVPLFEPVWTGGDTCVIVIVPHPSGRNRWWNSAANRSAARTTVTALLTTMESELGPVEDCRSRRNNDSRAAAPGDS